MPSAFEKPSEYTPHSRPFIGRMPLFVALLHRSGWRTKDNNQSCFALAMYLRVNQINRDGFFF